MTESMIGGDNNNAVQGTVTGSVSLKHIARRAAHAAERDVILQILEQTQWNRVRATERSSTRSKIWVSLRRAGPPATTGA